MSNENDSPNEHSNETFHRVGNRQTIIDMPSILNSADNRAHSSASNEVRPDDESENEAQNSNQWNINIEITPETFNNASREDVSALFNSIRQILAHIDLVYFVPEVHFLNMFMLFSVISTALVLTKLVSLSGLILLAIVRFVYYYDAYRFDLKSESQFMNILVRIGIRNLLIYLIYDQQVFFDVLSFNVVESQSFTYVLFVVSMANLMVLDVVLAAKVLIAYLSFIQIRKKREIFKLANYAVLVYLALLPIVQWYAYIANIWIALPYLALKFTIFAYLVCQTCMVFKQFVHTAKLGSAPSRDELSGQICAICHSEPEKSIKTNCGHIFDEQCLREWLEVKNECPLCRATVVEKHKNYPTVYVFPPYVF